MERREKLLWVKPMRNFIRQTRVSVNVKATTTDKFQGSIGLMGSYPEGKKVPRNGVTVMEDVIEFGKEWQVLVSEPMLFRSIEGVQHPQICAMPDKSTKNRKRRLGEAMIT